MIQKYNKMNVQVDYKTPLINSGDRIRYQNTTLEVSFITKSLQNSVRTGSNPV